MGNWSYFTLLIGVVTPSRTGREPTSHDSISYVSSSNLVADLTRTVCSGFQPKHLDAHVLKKHIFLGDDATRRFPYFVCAERLGKLWFGAIHVKNTLKYKDLFFLLFKCLGVQGLLLYSIGIHSHRHPDLKPKKTKSSNMREKTCVCSDFFFGRTKEALKNLCFSQCMQSLPAVGQGGTEKLQIFPSERTVLQQLSVWKFWYGCFEVVLNSKHSLWAKKGDFFLYSRCQFRARAESMSDTPVPKRHPWKAPGVFTESQKEAGMERHILNLKVLRKKSDPSFCEIFFGVKNNPLIRSPLLLTVQRDIHWFVRHTEVNPLDHGSLKHLEGDASGSLRRNLPQKDLQTLGHGMSFMWMSKKLWVSKKVS